MGFLDRILDKEHGHEHLRCAACGGEFHTQAELEKHAAADHPAPLAQLECAACGGAFASPEALEAHAKTSHAM